MKLLLDEMWSPVLAGQLRRAGIDTVSVAERPDLRGCSDEVVFAAALAEGRAVVTENVVDYRLLAARAIDAGHGHCGVIFTSHRSYPRSDNRTPGRLVSALVELHRRRRDLGDAEFWL